MMTKDHEYLETQAVESEPAPVGAATFEPAGGVASGAVAVLAVALLCAAVLGKSHGATRSRCRGTGADRYASGWGDNCQDSVSQHPSDLDLAPTDTLFCPVCLSEFVRGTEYCEDCGVELVDESDIPDDEPPAPQRVLRIGHVYDGVVAQLVRAVLEESRIPCAVSRSSILGAIGTDIYVFEGDVLRAKKIVLELLGELTPRPLG